MRKPNMAPLEEATFVPTSAEMRFSKRQTPYVYARGTLTICGQSVVRTLIAHFDAEVAFRRLPKGKPAEVIVQRDENVHRLIRVKRDLSVPVMAPQDFVRLEALRQMTFQAIDRAIAIDSHHKSYEGALDLTFAYPNRFAEVQVPEVVLELHCYVLGPSRHYEWRGDTLAQAIDLAERDVSSWIANFDADERTEAAE